MIEKIMIYITVSGNTNYFKSLYKVIGSKNYQFPKNIDKYGII